MTYQVHEWDQHFENDRSRTRKHCTFVCVPNKQHGMGFARIMAEPDGAAIYGIWAAILGACSQQSVRAGWLTANGESTGSAWGAADLALKFRRPVAEVQRALDVLCSSRIGWLIKHETTNETYDSPPTHRAVTASSPPTPPEWKGIEGNGNEQKGIESPLPPTGELVAVLEITPGNVQPPKAVPCPAPKGPLQLRAERMFCRRPETPLTSNEERAFKKNKAAIQATSEADWQALERYYGIGDEDATVDAPGCEFARKDLTTLLNNWNGEIDRARAWKPGADNRTEKLAELGRATRELQALGKASDHDPGSPRRLRHKELTQHIALLRETLGVVA